MTRMTTKVSFDGTLNLSKGKLHIFREGKTVKIHVSVDDEYAAEILRETWCEEMRRTGTIIICTKLKIDE